jgi:hypothetical protein
MTGLLTPNQLTDLLNYMLRLPVRNGKTVIREPMAVFVVKSWPIKPDRRRAERWCDCQLMQAGILEKPHAGRWHPEIPKCLQHWTGTMARVASASGR